MDKARKIGKLNKKIILITMTISKIYLINKVLFNSKVTANMIKHF